MPASPHPAALLDGVSVVDFSRYLPGPFCTLQLAWLGAAVTTIEQPPGGDPLRHMPPLGPDEQSLASASLARGKQPLLLDLRDEADLQRALQLCDAADVVVESFRPGIAERIGIGPVALRERNPGLVYCSISGYGQSGPWSQVAGHDANYLATSGLLQMSGGHDAPALTPVPLADLAGGSLATSAICAALVRRAATGEGSVIDISLAESALALQAMSLPGAHTSEGVRGEGTLTGGLACYSLYRCADGEYLAVCPIEPKFFHRLCALLDLQLPADQQFDLTAQEALRAAIGERLATRSARHWHDLLATEETCATRVAPAREVGEHPQLVARGAFEQLHGDPTLLAPASPFVVDGQRLTLAAARQAGAPTSGHA